MPVESPALRYLPVASRSRSPVEQRILDHIRGYLDDPRRRQFAAVAIPGEVRVMLALDAVNRVLHGKAYVLHDLRVGSDRLEIAKHRLVRQGWVLPNVTTVMEAGS